MISSWNNLSCSASKDWRLVDTPRNVSSEHDILVFKPNKGGYCTKCTKLEGDEKGKRQGFDVRRG